jgi:hypothetical protein
MVTWKKTMMASAGGGDGGWVAQLMPTTTNSSYQFEATRGLKCRFLSDGSIVDQQVRRYGATYYTTMTKWDPNGDLNKHIKITDSNGNRIDTTECILWVDWDDSDTIYQHSRGAVAGEIHMEINSDLDTISWAKTASNSGSTGFTVVQETMRLFAWAGNTFQATGHRLDNGNKDKRFSGSSSFTVSNMGYDNLYMGNYRQGGFAFNNGNKQYIPMKLNYNIGTSSYWARSTRIGTSSSVYQTQPPDIATSGYTNGASATDDYDLYVGGARSYPGDSQNIWSYLSHHANSDGSLVNAKIISVSDSTGSPATFSSRRYQSIRGLAVGSDGDVWAAHGLSHDAFTILHFSSNLSLNKALTFKRLGSGNTQNFSPFVNNYDYSSLDLSQDEEFLVCSAGNNSPNNEYRGTITFKIPSDLSCVDATYDLPTTAAGITEWQGTGSDGPTSGTNRFQVYDSTSYFTISDAYTEQGTNSIFLSETNLTDPTSPTTTIGTDALYSAYGPQDI